MKFLYYILGAALFGFAVWGDFISPHTSGSWGFIRLGVLLAGGFLIYRARTNQPLLGTQDSRSALLQISKTRCLRERRLMALTSPLWIIGLMIVLFGRDDYWGYNANYPTIVVISSSVLWVIAASFLWWYLRCLRKSSASEVR